MRKNILVKILTPDTKLHLWVISVLVIMIGYYNRMIGGLGLMLVAYLIYHNIKIQSNRKTLWTKYVEDLSADMDSVTRHAILNSPTPLTVVEFDGEIIWYNKNFSDIIDCDDLLEKNIENIIPSLKLDTMLTNKEKYNKVDIGEKCYKPLYNIVKTDKEHDDRYIIMIYWIDVTEYNNLLQKYNAEKSSVIIIEVDNYDDVLKEVSEENKPLIIAEIDRRINLWCSEMEAVIQKYQKDKYIVFMQRHKIEAIETRKFNILDEIREIETGNNIPVTLSMGVGLKGETLAETKEYAKAALDLALGRGGDQAVVKREDIIEFYGGKTKAVEKRNKVKARVIAHALRQLIEEASDVIIMGHKFPDMDSLGAAVGVYRGAKNRDKNAYIVFNRTNAGIKILHQELEGSNNYNFVTNEEALNIVNKDTLLVVVDTHKPSFTQCPELLDKVDNIVLIDHHRRGAEFIDNTVLKYLEPYASSTCELVTEILLYMDDKIKIGKLDAESLLAGITVDTKYFTFKTGVRTFEAASYLRRAGADTTNVKQFFQDDLDTFVARAEVVKSAKDIGRQIALSICPKGITNQALVAAQAADKLLNIRGIIASFVLGYRDDDEIIISGRSLGDINVQVILEKIGGGGHLTVAGAQLSNLTIEEAIEKLEKAIDEYFEEVSEE